LHTSQPALSAKIQQVEDVLGARLFDRNTRSVALTQIARDMLPAVERILGETEALLGRARDASVGITGRVVVAALPSFSSTVLPAAIAKFRSEHPGISIALKDALAQRIADLVRGDHVDFGISSTIVGERQVDFTPLTTDHMAVVFRRDHPVADLRRPRLEDVVDYPLILMDSSSSVRRIIEETLFAMNRLPQPLYEAAYMSTAIGMVRAGLGITILPSSTLEVQSATDLAWRQLANRSLARKIGVLRRRGRSLSPAAESFIAFLLQTTKPLKPVHERSNKLVNRAQRARRQRRN
jgi:DNA-binding transcriptional LysR family regulator